MRQGIAKRTAGSLAILMFLLSFVTMITWSCSPSEYDEPTQDTTTAPVTTLTSSLISVETLKSWMDQGLVNKQGGNDRVVIIEVSSQSAYDGEHIPGAIFIDWATELQPNRFEGVATSAQMVMDGPGMDALIQRAGIDENTTVVFTGDGAFKATRGWVTFRYWGFPKERLKVLDGYNFAWKAASYPMTTEVPNVAASDYSVTPGGVNRVRTDMRASLGEMIAAVKSIDAGTENGVIIDGRSAPTAGSYSGTAPATPGVFAPLGDYVAFEGHMKNAVALDYKTLTDSTTKEYLPESELLTLFTATTIGMDSTKTAYVICRTGNIASELFFVLDAILGWDAVWYDASWSQWGQMSVNSAKGGQLPAGSVWNTETLTDSIYYNVDGGKTIEALPLDYAESSRYTSTDDPRANQIENEDSSYINPASAVSGGASGGTSGGSSGGSSGGGNTGC